MAIGTITLILDRWGNGSTARFKCIEHRAGVQPAVDAAVGLVLNHCDIYFVAVDMPHINIITVC